MADVQQTRPTSHGFTLESTSLSGGTDLTQTLHDKLADECDSIVNRFRQRQIDKCQAIFLLTKAAIRDTAGDDSDEDYEEVSNKVYPYQGILEHVEQELNESGPSHSLSEGRLEAPDRVEDSGEQSGRNAGRTIDTQSDSGRDGVDAKKQKIEPNLKNLKHPINIAKVRTLSPQLQETLDTLATWAPNVKEVKQQFVNHAACPEFPHTEWDNIIMGRPVNLDAVFSSLSSLKTDEKRTEKIGDDVEIIYAGSEPATTIVTGQDWSSAWIRLARAYRFAFPHRQDELDSYEVYINNKFCQQETPFHFCIINFDKAVQKRIGSRRDLELSDFREFMDLYESNFLPSGKHFSDSSVTGNSSSSATGKAVADRKKEYCRRWNASTCKSTATACRFRHVCSSKGCGS
ncbi:hypothetical protein DFH29DRAFT_966045, partial [Suillus ampliporus]